MASGFSGLGFLRRTIIYCNRRSPEVQNSRVTGVYDKRNEEALPRIRETADFFLYSFTEIEYDR